VEYQWNRTGVEWSITGVEPEYEWSISGVEVEYELSYLTISHCTPLLLQCYSTRTPTYSGRTPLVLLFQRSTSEVLVEYQ
jgi:hypothetical protein